MKRTCELLKVPEEKVIQVLDRITADNLLVRLDNLIYLPEFYEKERSIASKLKQLISCTASPANPDYDGLKQDQVEALTKAVKSQVFILTGPPGTGKTYTIKRIINSFPKVVIALAAPTGRGSKRIYEESGYQAKTIHKLLEPQKNSKGFYFTRTADNPLEADIIIIDETSMIDLSLMSSLMDAVDPGTRIIFVGDTYQLPSVGPGNILKDMISSEVIPTTELTIIKRQDEGLIIRNCSQIKDGKDIEVENSDRSDFFFLPRASEVSIRETIFELITQRLPESSGFDPLKDIQIVSPLRERTSLSCKALNKVCQSRLNRNPEIDNCPFKTGDKVIQTKNRYDLDIINGDIGYIRSINQKEQTIYVDFENPQRRAELPLYENNLELAYAITCHRFQGSEAPVIIIPIHRSFPPMLMQRNWVYTAISRAKDLCILVGQREEIPKIIRRNQQQKRFTNLARFLNE